MNLMQLPDAKLQVQHLNFLKIKRKQEPEWKKTKIHRDKLQNGRAKREERKEVKDQKSEILKEKQE